MRNSVLRFLLILSLLLNASIFAAAGYSHYKQSRSPGAVHKPGEDVRSHIFEELSLKPDQQKVMRRKADEFHADLEKKRNEVEEIRVRLLSLMRAEVPDTKAIQITIGEINRVQEEMQRAVVAHMLEFKSLLDKDQQKKFLDLIEGAMTNGTGLHCPENPSPLESRLNQ